MQKQQMLFFLLLVILINNANTISANGTRSSGKIYETDQWVQATGYIQHDGLLTINMLETKTNESYLIIYGPNYTQKYDISNGSLFHLIDSILVENKHYIALAGSDRVKLLSFDGTQWSEIREFEGYIISPSRAMHSQFLSLVHLETNKSHIYDLKSNSIEIINQAIDISKGPSPSWQPFNSTHAFRLLYNLSSVPDFQTEFYSYEDETTKTYSANNSLPHTDLHPRFIRSINAGDEFLVFSGSSFYQLNHSTFTYDKLLTLPDQTGRQTINRYFSYDEDGMYLIQRVSGEGFDEGNDEMWVWKIIMGSDEVPFHIQRLINYTLPSYIRTDYDVAIRWDLQEFGFTTPTFIKQYSYELSDGSKNTYLYQASTLDMDFKVYSDFTTIEDTSEAISITWYHTLSSSLILIVLLNRSRKNR